MNMNEINFRAGYVAIIGRPNVGKSTLLNNILGEKIAAVSRKPQTTRNRILGIHTLDNFQIVFLDTPGIHTAKDKINKFMVKEALGVLGDADLVLYLIDSMADPGPQDETIIKHLKNYNGKKILVANKIDLTGKNRLNTVIEKFTSLCDFDTTINISAIDKKYVNQLVDSIVPFLPEGPPYYPEDIISSASERFICQELIKEKIYLFTGDELPYSSAVEINSFKEERDIVRISAKIFVERNSQKGMIIGKSGSKIKKLGTESRKDIEKFLDKKVFLELKVSVQKNWTKDDFQLKRFGYKVVD